MRSLKMALAGVAAFGLASAALADSWAKPTPRVFGSEYGMHGFKVLKPQFGGKSVGVFFSLDEKGQEKIIWEAPLVNTPHRVVAMPSSCDESTSI